jgi:hypothetical protein
LAQNVPWDESFGALQLKRHSGVQGLSSTLRSMNK